MEKFYEQIEEINALMTENIFEILEFERDVASLSDMDDSKLGESLSDLNEFSEKLNDFKEKLKNLNKEDIESLKFAVSEILKLEENYEKLSKKYNHSHNAKLLNLKALDLSKKFDDEYEKKKAEEIDQEINPDLNPELMEDIEIQELIDILKKINPGIEITTKVESINLSLLSSIPLSELKLPDGFYFNENNCLTNKNNTKSGNYIEIKIEEIQNKRENESENRSETEEEYINVLDIISEIEKLNPKANITTIFGASVNGIKICSSVPENELKLPEEYEFNENTITNKNKLEGKLNIKIDYEYVPKVDNSLDAMIEDLKTNGYDEKKLATLINKLTNHNEKIEKETKNNIRSIKNMFEKYFDSIKEFECGPFVKNLPIQSFGSVEILCGSTRDIRLDGSTIKSLGKIKEFKANVFMTEKQLKGFNISQVQSAKEVNVKKQGNAYFDVLTLEEAIELHNELIKSDKKNESGEVIKEIDLIKQEMGPYEDTDEYKKLKEKIDKTKIPVNKSRLEKKLAEKEEKYMERQMLLKEIVDAYESLLNRMPDEVVEELKADKKDSIEEKELRKILFNKIKNSPEFKSLMIYEDLNILANQLRDEIIDKIKTKIKVTKTEKTSKETKEVPLLKEIDKIESFIKPYSETDEYKEMQEKIAASSGEEKDKLIEEFDKKYDEYEKNQQVLQNLRDNYYKFKDEIAQELKEEIKNNERLRVNLDMQLDFIKKKFEEKDAENTFANYSDKDKLMEELTSDILDKANEKKKFKVIEKNNDLLKKCLLGAGGFLLGGSLGIAAGAVPAIGTTVFAINTVKLFYNITKHLDAALLKFKDPEQAKGKSHSEKMKIVTQLRKERAAKIIEKIEKRLPKKAASVLHTITTKASKFFEANNDKIQIFVNGVSYGYAAGYLLDRAFNIHGKIADAFTGDKNVPGNTVAVGTEPTTSHPANNQGIASNQGATSSATNAAPTQPSGTTSSGLGSGTTGGVSTPPTSDVGLGSTVIPQPTPGITAVEELASSGNVDLTGLAYGYTHSGSNDPVRLLQSVADTLTFDKVNVVDGVKWVHFKQANGLGYAWFREEDVLDLLNSVGRGR